MSNKIPPLLVIPFKPKTIIQLFWEKFGGLLLFGLGAILGYWIGGWWTG